MERYTYTPRDVCPQAITFEIESGILTKVHFEGGCNGNLQALSKLVQGMKVEDVIAKLRGIDCEGRGTSCSDQLTRGLEEVLRQHQP